MTAAQQRIAAFVVSVVAVAVLLVFFGWIFPTQYKARLERRRRWLPEMAGVALNMPRLDSSVFSATFTYVGLAATTTVRPPRPV